MNTRQMVIGMAGAMALTLLAGSSAWAAPGRGAAGATPAARPVGVAPMFIDAADHSVVLSLPIDQVKAMAAAQGAGAPGLAERVRVDGVPLDLERTVSLELVRFRVAAPGARFETVTQAGTASVAFDPDQVVLLRGRVEGFPESRVFLGIGTRVTNGWIDLGPMAAAAGQPRKYYIREARPGLVPAGPDAGSSVGVEIFPALPGVAGSRGEPPVPVCGTVTVAPVQDDRLVIGAPNAAEPVLPRPASGLTDMGPILGMKQVEIAVDTDNEFFSIFNDTIAANEYILQLYGAMSDIYIHEVRATVVVTYTRLWETPDPWTNQDPLGQFRNNWNNNQQSVHRDTAQLLLGRRNLSAGGVAYLPGLCNNSSYSWAGYVLGYFSDPLGRDDGERDVRIAAHELGHNVGARHNHDYGLDVCQVATSPAARGGLMAYCGQTVSGAGLNIDPRFETRVREDVRAIIEDRSCIASDCNMNGVADATDISLGSSQDVNQDGIPDECQDCNQNQILDPIEVSLGQVPDLNQNGIPDGCEPDCNQNGVPDDRDIALGTSADAYLNGIPDECETDCDNDNVSDYTQIRVDMTLDVNRDAILDGCQDCDNDQIIDRYALNHAHHLWATSLTDPLVREFHSYSGVRTQLTDPAGAISEGGDVLITPDGRILVTSSADSRIVEFNRDGTVAGVFAAAPNVDEPTFMTLDPAGDLLVSNRGNGTVWKFDLPSGASMGAFATGIDQPYGLAYRPDGNLYVAAQGSNNVLKFNGTTGNLMGTFVAAGSGGLFGPRGICWLPDGRLLVASINTFQVLAYDAAGASLGQWQTGGNGVVLLLDEPWDIIIGPNGDVFVSASGLGPESAPGTAPLHVTTARVFQYEPDTGWMVRAYIVGQDTGLYRASGLAFHPDMGSDCNLNATPDNCDISSGRSTDANRNGIPDECECVADLTTGAIPGQPGYGVPNGAVNNDDFFYYLAQYAAGNTAVADMTTTAVPGAPGYGVPNGTITTDDFFYYLIQWAAGC